MTAISLPIFTDIKFAEDGSTLLQQKYQNIALTIPDADIADSVIIDFRNRSTQDDATIEELLNSALVAYTTATNWTPYLLQTTFAPKRIDQSVLSLFGEKVIYTGNSHPEIHYESVTYDLTTGSALTTTDILTPGKMDDFTNLVIAALEAKITEIALYPDYQDTVLATLPNSENWYFTEHGLAFFFSPYEIAPYTSGIIVAEIPYAKLPGILLDAFFPAEKDSASGTLLASPFTVEAANTLTQSTELICQDAAKQIILHTDKHLTNLKIAVSDNYIDYTIFATAALTPGDGVVLHVPSNAALNIQYSSDGETIYQTLQIDTKGNIQLS